MKRILPFVLVFCLLLTGCQQVGGLLGGAGAPGSSGAPEESAASDEVIYSGLDRLISSPDSSNSSLPERFTFVAMLLNEKETVEFQDDNEAGIYHSACISRNIDDYFALEVSGIEGTFHSGDIVKITGELNGLIYWTEDNSQVEILDIKAISVEAYEPPATTADNSPTVELGGDGYEFLGAHKTEIAFGDAIVVYFNYTNNGSGDATPSLGSFYVECGGNEAESTIFPPDEVDASALEADLFNKTYAGKTQLYYRVYTITQDTDDADPSEGGDDANSPEDGDAAAPEGDQEYIYFSLYDDEFRMTYSIGIPVAESLGALTGEDAAADGAQS